MRKNWDVVLPALGMSAREFVHQHAEQGDRAIAERLSGVGFSTNHQNVQRVRLLAGILKQPSWGGLVQPSPFPKYDSPPTFEGDALVLGDVEFPYHEHEFLNRTIDLCQAWRIEHIWFNGDLLHHHSLSKWEPAWIAGVAPGALAPDLVNEILAVADRLGKKGDELREMVNRRGVSDGERAENISDEWAYARQSLSAMRSVFKSATLILGNHEGRLLAALHSPTAPDDLKRILIGESDWMKVGPYYWGIITSGGVQWRATHPKNISVMPSKVSAELADKFHVNVMQSHSHLWGMTQSKSGQYVGVEIGCVVDGARLPYYIQRDTTRPMWQHGAAIIRDGHCWLLHPRWTDWNRLRGM